MFSQLCVCPGVGGGLGDYPMWILPGIGQGYPPGHDRGYPKG